MRNKKKLIVSVVVLILIIIVGLLWQSYFVEIFKKEEINGEYLKREEVEEYFQLILHAFAYDDYAKSLYDKDIIQANELLNGAKLAMASSKVDYSDLKEYGEYTSYITEQTMKDAFKMVFGDNIKYMSGNFHNLGCEDTVYNDEKQIYISHYACGGTSNVGNVFVEAIKDGNKIVITSAQFFIDYSNEDGEFVVDHTGKRIEGIPPSVENTIASKISENIGEYKDLLAQFEYTFINENGNYVFYSIKRIN